MFRITNAMTAPWAIWPLKNCARRPRRRLPFSSRSVSFAHICRSLRRRSIGISMILRTFPWPLTAICRRGMPAVAFGGTVHGRNVRTARLHGFQRHQPFRGFAAGSIAQRRLKHGYYASVSFTDVQVGRLLDEADRLGLGENTIIILWGDHGWKLGEHNGWCKQTNFDVDTRAPLMIYATGVKANGQRSGTSWWSSSIFTRHSASSPHCPCRKHFKA